MPGRGKYKRVARALSAEDKEFIRLVQTGMNRSKAYRLSHPDHPTVVKYIDAVKTEAPAEEKRRLSQSVTQLAKDKLQTNHIQSALTTYTKKMEDMADDSLVVLHDILLNGRSEKVRADIGMEFVRHRVGTPTQKVQVSEEKNITITFGDPHPEDIIEGEVLDDIPEAELL